MTKQKHYTTKELVTITGRSIQGLINRANKECWKKEKRGERGGGFTWLFESLPADIQAAIALAESKATPPAKSRADGLTIPEWSYKLGQARYTLLLEWRKFTAQQAKKQGGKAQATAAFVIALRSRAICRDSLEVTGPVSDKTLYRWDKTLRDNAGEWQCLCDGRGLWQKGGAKGLGQIGPEAEKAFLAAWLTPNQPSKAFAYRVMSELLTRQNLPVPHLSTVKHFANRYEQTNQDVVVLMREGEKALIDKLAPYISRDWDSLEAGDCLFCDGHTFNFEILHPFTGRPHRATLICWFDAASRLPVGWEIMPTENTAAISSALRMAVLNLRKFPKSVYLDNGKAFRSKYFTAETDFSMLNGLYSRLGIAVQFATPYNARAKTIERFFRTFDLQCQRLLPGYTGNTIDNKPAWRRRNEKFHQSRHSAFVPTVREAGEIFKRFVYWYGHNEHGGLKGRLPWEVFEAGRGPEDNPALDLNDLNRHFQWSQKITPRRAGLTLSGVRYESQCLYGLNKPVFVKYSFADMNQIYIYDADGHYLGEAKPTEFLNPLAKLFGDDLDQMKLNEALKQQAALKKATLAKARQLERITGGIGGQAFEVMPYVLSAKTPRAKLELLRPAEPAPEPMSPQRAKEMEEQVARMIELTKANSDPRPKIFKSDHDRYDWAFQASFINGQALRVDDVEFMTRYENSSEYKNFTRYRYEQLREIYSRRQE